MPAPQKRRWPRPSVQGAFRQAKQRAGLTKREVAIQSLRPSYATHLLEAGVHRRLVCLKDRTVTYRKPGRARQRTPSLDVIALSRRVLQHVLPDGFLKVRHFGFMHASCAIPPATMRLMIVKRHPVGCKTPHLAAPAPCVASCPTCGGQMWVVMRRWTVKQAVLDTG